MVAGSFSVNGADDDFSKVVAGGTFVEDGVAGTVQPDNRQLAINREINIKKTFLLWFIDLPSFNFA